MSDPIPFPGRFSTRDLIDLYSFGRVGALEVLLMRERPETPSPLALAIRANGVFAEIATIEQTAGDPNDIDDLVKAAYNISTCLMSALQTIRERGEFVSGLLAEKGVTAFTPDLDPYQGRSLGTVGRLEVLLMHPNGPKACPYAIVLCVGSTSIEVASGTDEFGTERALWSSYRFADALFTTLKVVKGRSVLRDAFTSSEFL